MTLYMPSSVREGTRPSAFRMRSYSSGVMLCWASSSGVTATGSGTTAEVVVVIALTFIFAWVWRACRDWPGKTGHGARSKPVRYFDLPTNPGRDGGTGRRSGLKIRRPLRSWGFDPPSRHHKIKYLQTLQQIPSKLKSPRCHL